MFVALDTPVPSFVPKDYLIIEDLDKHMEVKGGNNFMFWTGDELELESYKIALEKKSEAAKSATECKKAKPKQ